MYKKEAENNISFILHFVLIYWIFWLDNIKMTPTKYFFNIRPLFIRYGSYFHNISVFKQNWATEAVTFRLKIPLYFPVFEMSFIVVLNCLTSMAHYMYTR